MTRTQRITWSLFALRLGVFLVMFMWTLDKFVNPEHAGQVYAHFYKIGGLESLAFYLIGAVEMAIILAFLVGYRKRLTYGLVLLFHGVSTLSSWPQYIDPFASSHLLFFAAWPMLAACLALYLLREEDTLFSIDVPPPPGG